MTQKKLHDLFKKGAIEIKGAKVHNLKNVSVSIPRNQLTVITGLSGSGKSSLAFDTLYAEGQRRYVESLSSYARQFLGKLDKPNVDKITGISPAIAIEQKVISRNARSTVGTSTEIYDYLKLLFARVGDTYSPISGEMVKKHTVEDVVKAILQMPDEAKVMIAFSVNLSKNTEKEIDLLIQKGYTRAIHNHTVERLENLKNTKPTHLSIVVDRLTVSKQDEQFASRVYDSVDIAFFEGKGECLLYNEKNEPFATFNIKFELDGITFEEPTANFFSFNNPLGACKTCEGYGSVIGIDPDLVIPDKTLSVYEDAIVCWKGEKMSEWKDFLVRASHKFDFPIHRPIEDLTRAQYNLLWTGNQYFEGLNSFFKNLEENAYKIQYRVMLSRYRGKTLCPDCHGTRLRKDAAYVKIESKSIMDLVLMPVDKLLQWFNQVNLPPFKEKIANRILIEVKNRLNFLCDVGLGYLTLNRLSNTLSGGESQRINLATSLGSSLVGSIYILDEPSIGLHPRDTNRLIQVIQSLKNVGNSVIVVEHDEEVIRAADYLIDMGPEAGSIGGEVMFQGLPEDIENQHKSITGQYLSGKQIIELPQYRTNLRNYIEIKGATENNLKNISVKLPLNALTVITGVSGSGKSTLVKKILYPALKRLKGGYPEKPGAHKGLAGEINSIQQIEFIDQNPIGKSSRSNPVTYLKAFDEIRNLFAKQKMAELRGYKPSYFSFNVEGGRCETCQGEGQIKVEMQFMADVYLTCDDCKGKRYKQETLEVEYQEKNIADILDFTVDEAITFFKKDSKNTLSKKIVEKLMPLQEVGLGYVPLGQSSSTLSGGEAQRIKLASFLAKGSNSEKTLFIFDEPTTGLHFHDVKKLLKALNALIDVGHSVIVIEHNLDVIKCADYVVDLGPEGGDNGGTLVFSGTVPELLESQDSYTGQYLKTHLKLQSQLQS
ncbi:MAG: excinuclease ABC subunit UvrA [Luteibaculaceae bacterium]